MGRAFQLLRLASGCALALTFFSSPVIAVDDEEVAQFRAQNAGMIITVLGPIDAASAGVTLEFDLLGAAFLLEEKVIDTRGAADTVADLISKGYADQLLLSQDVCTKTQLKAYGGNGYDYVLSEVVPYLRGTGATEEDVEKLLVANPTRLFSITP